MLGRTDRQCLSELKRTTEKQFMAQLVNVAIMYPNFKDQILPKQQFLGIS